MIPFPRSKCSSGETDKEKGPSKTEVETMAKGVCVFARACMCDIPLCFCELI